MSRTAIFALLSVALFGIRILADTSHTMPHLLRDVVNYDAPKMVSLVDKELNTREADPKVFFNSAARVLAQTVLVQPDFEAREAALRELKGKLEPEEYDSVLSRASDFLLSVTSDADPADQATAFVALTNLVVEARVQKDRAILQKIADAGLEPSDAAKRYAEEPLQNLTSPSVEARASLDQKGSQAPN